MNKYKYMNKMECLSTGITWGIWARDLGPESKVTDKITLNWNNNNSEHCT